MPDMLVIASDGTIKTPNSVGETVYTARTIRGLAGGDFTVRAAAGYYLILGSYGETIPLNDASNLTLSGFTATSIVGALNEIKTDVPALVTKLNTVASVDLTTTGSTAIYTVPAGKSCVVQDVLLRIATASGANGDAAVQVEITGSSGDVIPSTTLIGATATTDVFRLGPQFGGVFRVGAAADIFYLNVTSAESGTTLTVAVDVFGYTF